MTVTTVWRVRGECFDVDGFLRQHPEVSPSLVWRKGMRVGWKRSSETDSGANIPFCERPSISETMKVVRRWLAKYDGMLKTIQRQGVESTLDFGVYVGSTEQFVARLEFVPEDLALLARAGVGITVSAYPTSEE